MKRLLNRGLLVFVATAMLTIFIGLDVSAQRPSRSGGGSVGGGRSGTFSPSRGGSISRGPSTSIQNRGNYATGIGRSSGSRQVYGYTRPGYRVGYGYRPGYVRPYYRPYYSYYNFYRPFIGFRIGVLPYGYYPFYFGANQFYYSGGLFYQQNNNQYEVVVPPVGATVPSLPDDAQPVTINGIDYYEYKGVYYTQSNDVNGKVVYIVAGKDGVLNTGDDQNNVNQIGDLINELPTGCREVTIKNERYYVSPNDVYYEEVVDGNNVSYRVIGKMF
ncbi:DUF6515 family protein [Pedobacter sandarakinus]|uniref:DUF6515 family protein n=1 Tax=Pedobacter sandarakinus TaxID=353156 RepID=UPI00224713C0|nr:DUF6515 family protein [Pedobacter sandarakinus]MCX2575997.1 hypothetical protein [Pedobacter sandarakinus]